MDIAVPVGPFELHAMIGVGGAGEVWRGVHVAQGVPVALKVITAARARDARYREAFANEVRAVAALDHPGIVQVFETGVIGGRAEEVSMGRMVAGSPYLAMELAENGALRSADAPPGWDDLRGMLAWLLDILAHAHAHGVIHRDLKPGNVLLFKDPAVEGYRSGVTRLRLTDFGLAHATDRNERAIKGTSGTPVFMAPEQFRGAWRDFGPWTDLYALGCLAWALTTGTPPFRGKGVTALMQAHLGSELPKLEPRLPVPEGFEPWLRRLMEKEPEHRYQRASDAAWALFALGDPLDTPIPPERRYRSVRLTTAHTLTRSWPDFERAARAAAQQAAGPVAPPGANLALRRHPPQPAGWELGFNRRSSIQLVGAGLGLYGLRAIPLVGRGAERDALWAALQEARSTREIRVVGLTGPAGIGKTRLAEWFCRRADEVGVAAFVRATHGPASGPADGLRRMVGSVLGTIGMPRPETGRRIHRWLGRRDVEDEYEAQALLELVWPSPEEERSPSPVRFGSANERYAAIYRLLAYHGGRDDDDVPRPIVLWLDDVQWGRDALGLASWLQRLADGGPMVVVLTARDEALHDLPLESKLLDDILARPGARRLPIGPLEARDRAALVRGLLYLEGDVAAQVMERTAGNPLFAVQLVGDWVQRGLLEVGKTGFQLQLGERPSLPDGIHQLWEQRLERALDGRPPESRSVLEIASILGNEVDEQEWRSACLVAGLAVPPDLLPALLARRLARAREGGWTFEHAMLRESLERAARESGRIGAWNHAVAASLQIRWSIAREPGLAGRLARHLVDAGRPEEADEPLAVGASEHRAMSDYHGALKLLDQREALLHQLEARTDDPRWGECWALRAESLVQQGRFDQAEEAALRLGARAGAYGWPALVSTGYRHAATVAAKRGQLGLAEERLRCAESAARDVDELEVARCLIALCDVVRLRGRFDDALKLGRRALGRFDALEDARGRADAMTALAAVARSMGDHEKTEEYSRKAVEMYEQMGSRFGVAVARNILAEILRLRGDLAGAEDAYRTAENALRALGSPEAFVPQLNLALVLMQRGLVVEARDTLLAVLATLERSGRKAYQGVVHALLLPSMALLLDWDGWDRHAGRARELLTASGIADVDVAEALEDAARHAEAADRRLLAGDALSMAAAQWRALGKPDRAATLAGRAEAIAPR